MAVFPRTRQMSDHEAATSVLEGLMGEKDDGVRGAVSRLLLECLEIDREATLEFLVQWRGRISPALLESILAGVSAEDRERIRGT